MYKLTNQNLQTYDGFQWEIGKWYRIPDKNRGQGICTESYFHCYSHPLLAVLFNLIQGKIHNPRLFKINVKGRRVSDNDTKYGYTMMRLKEELPVPEITTTQRVKFAILCAKQVTKDKQWNKWADNWLSGKNRTWDAANEAYANTTRVDEGPARTAARAAALTASLTDTLVGTGVTAAYTAVQVADINLIKLVKEAVKC